MIDETTGKARGELLFAILFVLLSLYLLSQIGTETKFSGVEKLWEKGQILNGGKLFAQPAFWPLVGVVGMSIFGLAHILTSIKGRNAADELKEGANWLLTLEYFFWFMAYVFAAPQIGYLAATLIFMVLLALRAGYREPRMLLAAAGTGLAIVLVFKTGLSVKIPGGAVYEGLPQGLRTFMIVNF